MKIYFLYALLTFILGLDTLCRAQDFIWAKQLGGTEHDLGASIAIGLNGDTYTTGKFRGTADFDPGLGSYSLTSIGNDDIYVVKLDASGNFMWVKQMGSLLNEYTNSIQVDDNDNIYITGIFMDTMDFDPGPAIYNLPSGMFISKLDSSGNFLWAKQYGSLPNDEPLGIGLDQFKNVYSVGIFTDTVDFDPGPGISNLTSTSSNDVFISKLDSSGNFVWARQFDGTSSTVGTSIAVDSIGNVYSTGYFGTLTVDFDPGPGIYNLTPLGYTDCFVSKLDSGGNFVWAKQFGGSGGVWASSIALDNSGNVYTTGFFNDSADFDPGIGSYNLISAGTSDIFICKLNSDGEFMWTKQMAGQGTSSAYSIDIDVAGNVYTTGFFGVASTDFDPGPGNYILTPNGLFATFISKLDSLGNFLWAGSLTNTPEIVGNCVVVGLNSDVYITGNFVHTPDFDPGSGIYNLTAIPNFSSEIYILKLGITTDISEIMSIEDLMIIFPNPSSNSFTISFKSPTYKRIEIVNVLGETIYSEDVSGILQKEINIQGISSGIYFAKLFDGNNYYSKKLIIENF